MTLQISNHVVGYIDVLGYKQLLKEYSEEKFLNIRGCPKLRGN